MIKYYRAIRFTVNETTKIKVPRLSRIQEEYNKENSRLEIISCYAERLKEYKGTEEAVKILELYLFYKTTDQNINGYYYWLQESTKEFNELITKWSELSSK